jgi:integrase
MALEAYHTLAKGKPVGAPLCSQLEDDESTLTQSDYWFVPCVQAAGLVDFHFHDLRHTAASRWVMNGTPSSAVTLKPATYGHFKTGHFGWPET